jgi:hypothetical protein
MPFSSADPNAFVALGMQSALGTPQVTASKLRFAKYMSGTGFNPTPEVVNMREGGDGLDWGFTYKRTIKGDGQLVAAVRPEFAPQLFQMIPGGATWDGASAPANLTFHTGHASHPKGTLLLQHPGSLIPHLLSDLQFTGLTLSGKTGEPWQISAPYTAAQLGASFAGVTPTYYGDAPLLFHNLAPSGGYLVDGATDTTITEFSFGIALGVEELYAQTIDPDDVVVQNRDITYSFTRRIESATLWKKVAYGAGVAPTTSVATGSFQAIAMYGSGANTRYLSALAPLISYDQVQLTDLDPDGKTVYETYSGKVLKGATSALILNVQNAHASAYAP